MECKFRRDTISTNSAVTCVSFHAARGAWVTATGGAGSGPTHAQYAYLWKQWASGPVLRKGVTYRSGTGIRCHLMLGDPAGMGCSSVHTGWEFMLNRQRAWLYR